MTFIEALLLALALCVDTLVVSATTAFRSKMAYGRGLLMATILGFCQFAFPLVGAVIGDVSRSFIEAVDHWVAFGLLALVGGKMIVDSLSLDPSQKGEESGRQEKSPLVNRKWGRELMHYCMLGIATSIDGLAVGIGLGLEHTMGTVMWVVLLIGVVTFLISLLGVFLGKRNIPVPERTANLIAGVVLIGLGVKILLEHLFF
ncbi:MAG: manganese efflux pump [Bacteroidales bacterium]|nr:manganese efflux pump [Bacteroidales bacterium]